MRTLTPVLVVFFTGLSLANAQPAPNKDALILEVSAARQTGEAAVVSFTLPEKWQEASGFRLIQLDNKTVVPVQLLRQPKAKLLWLLDEPLKAGQSRRYELSVNTPATKLPDEKTAVCMQDDKGLTLQIGKRQLLRYNTAVIPCPIAKSEACRRSGFIHPLFNPAGQCVTDDFPPDHPHQHGVMFAWTSTTFEKRHVDFWNQDKKLGTVEHVKIQDKQDGPVFAQFTARLRHVDLSAPGGPKAALNETWTVRAYNLEKYVVFDLESVQSCAGKSPIQIDKYHYGGMALRGAREWFKKGNSDFLTSDGKTRTDGNHTRPRWVDLHGTIDGKKSGVAIFCHPENFHAPQPVRLHPSKPYFCWSPQVIEGFTIAPGKEYISRYRFVVHSGAPDAARLNAMWQDYAAPLEARMAQRHSSE